MSYLLHDVFLKTIRTNPNNIAIVMENGTQISYADLNSLSNRFAHILFDLKHNIRKNPYVGIFSPIHIQSVAAILGILKVGCAYVPFDEQSPIDRLVHIIDNTQLDIVIVDEHWYEKYLDLFRKPQLKYVLLLGDQYDKKNKLSNTIDYKQVLDSFSFTPISGTKISDDLAYILHSSGSTGVPKGIMFTHRNARTFVDWMQKEFVLTENDIVMSRAPFKFDLSIFDIFNTFKVGAKLVCYDWNTHNETPSKHIAYVNLLEKEKATVLYTTPSTFIVLLNKGNLSQAKINLRLIMYAGEPFPIPQLKRLKQTLPKTRIANIYGPTETNIITYYWINDILDGTTQIPLGQVVDDTEILIVSEDGKKICEPDEVGELWCRGDTVTLGYLGFKELTEASLITSPFHAYPVKFWRTGDFGYRDISGCLFYKGRKDSIVKVMGYRIEIGEVETALSEITAFDEFAVIAISDENEQTRLYCYYSLLPHAKFTPAQIIAFLKTKIPDYMIPYGFIEVDVIPKTSSGKIDRMHLAKLNQASQ